MELKLNLKSKPFSVRKVKKSSKLNLTSKSLLLHYLTQNLYFTLFCHVFQAFHQQHSKYTHLLYINIKENGHIINILHTLCANSLLLQENEPLFDAIAKCDDKKKDITGCQNIRTRSVKQRLFSVVKTLKMKSTIRGELEKTCFGQGFGWEKLGVCDFD